jgi:hypothetical protein
MYHVKRACLIASVCLYCIMLHPKQLDQNLMAKFRKTPQYTAACAEQQQQQLNAKLLAA